MLKVCHFKPGAGSHMPESVRQSAAVGDKCSSSPQQPVQLGTSWHINAFAQSCFYGSRPEGELSRFYPWLSIALALLLALFEFVFFFQAATVEGPTGLLAPERLGFTLAWITLVYLSIQLLTIPLTIAGRDRFLGVVDGMASIIPLGVSLVVIFGKPELLGTPVRWEAAFLLLAIAAIDLFGGYMFNIALSRRTMEVASSAI